MKRVQEQLLSGESENTDSDILDNDDLSNDVGLLASTNIIRTRIDYKD
jgi:hypothetical protein